MPTSTCTTLGGVTAKHAHGSRCVLDGTCDMRRRAVHAPAAGQGKVGSHMEGSTYRQAACTWRLDAERSRLAEGYVGLAEKIARARCRWGLEDLDDTRSDALWGLILATRSFQPDRGSFMTYATLRIEYAIRRGRQIRSGVPRSMWEGGDRLTPPVSLNAPMWEGGPQVLDLLPSPPDADEDLLADLLRQLPARECLVLRLRYFHDLTQSGVAAIIGCSQMQVSRIERAGLAKLREFVGDHPARSLVVGNAGAGTPG
jgi:DNA-directed RNA polymerase sigma subunit (sigma70/sigma32)